MNGSSHMRSKKTWGHLRTRRYVCAAGILTAVILIFLGGCQVGPGGDDNGDGIETSSLVGTWISEETVPFYGRSLSSHVEITLTEQDVSLVANVTENGDPVNSLTAQGSYTASQTELVFTYVSATHARETAPGVFDTQDLQQLSSDELEDFKSDFAGGTLYTLSDDQLTLTLNPNQPNELVFTRQGS